MKPPAGSATPRAKLLRRLRSYWRIEAANVVLMPALMLFIARAQVGWPALTAMLPMSGMLVAGTIYLWAKYRQVAFGAPIASALRQVAAVQLPLLLATLAAAVLCAWCWIDPGLTRGLAERWVVTAAALLAALEYINYYHRQLQHFDNAGDWQRLLSGRGFRVSPMRRDLQRAGLR